MIERDGTSCPQCGYPSFAGHGPDCPAKSTGSQESSGTSRVANKKPTFIATEAGLILNSPEGKKFSDEVGERVKTMDFETIGSMVSKGFYPALKKSVESKLDTLSIVEAAHKDDPDSADYINSVEEEYEAEKERLYQLDKIIGKTAIHKDLSASEISTLIPCIKGEGQEALAAELFLLRKLATEKKKKEGI